MRHVYIAHRLAGNVALNISSAGIFMSELADRLPIVPYGSWITLCRYWDESKREKGLEIDKQQISRVDELWCVGNQKGLSGGMTIESDHAKTIGKPVFDLTGMTVDEIVEWWKKGV
jgi:hypothetical protein